MLPRDYAGASRFSDRARAQVFTELSTGSTAAQWNRPARPQTGVAKPSTRLALTGRKPRVSCPFTGIVRRGRFGSFWANQTLRGGTHA
jgi:hypothetical protein